MRDMSKEWVDCSYEAILFISDHFLISLLKRLRRYENTVGNYNLTRPFDKALYQVLSAVQEYMDELAWGAAWLYKATNNSMYLDDARVSYTIYD
jgi:hypothetical protein